LGMWPYLRQLTYILPEHPFWWAASQKDCAILALLSSLRAGLSDGAWLNRANFIWALQ
jgi:hypothetical protein